MTHLKTAGLFFVLSFLAACGAQVVEFPIDAGSSGLDAGPGDAGPPTVTATLPASNATGVSFATVVTATFSRAMDPATLTNATTFTLKQGATAVAGTVTWVASNNTAQFSPAAPLGASLIYTATITTGAKDTGGLALAANFVWTFTTANAAMPPTVTSVTPLNMAMNVPLNVRPTATFSKAMDALTLSTTTFTLKQGLTAISGAVALDGLTNTATFTPAAPLTGGLVYTATITTGARDTGGLALAMNFVWTFTTASAPPTVISVTPLNNAMNVSVNVRPTATFSKPMDPLTITALTFTLKQGLNAVAGAVSYVVLTKTATFTPNAPLTVGHGGLQHGSGQPQRAHHLRGAGGADGDQHGRHDAHHRRRGHQPRRSDHRAHPGPGHRQHPPR